MSEEKKPEQKRTVIPLRGLRLGKKKRHNRRVRLNEHGDCVDCKNRPTKRCGYERVRCRPLTTRQKPEHDCRTCGNRIDRFMSDGQEQKYCDKYCRKRRHNKRGRKNRNANTSL